MYLNRNITYKIILVLVIILPTLIPGHIRIALGWLLSFLIYSGISLLIGLSFERMRAEYKRYPYILLLSYLFLPLFTLIDNPESWYPHLMPSYLTIGTTGFIAGFLLQKRRFKLMSPVLVLNLIFIFYTDNNLEYYFYTRSANYEPSEYLVGKRMDLSLVDLNGKLYTPELLRNKVCVLDFWSTSCGYCIEKHPVFDQLYAKYKEKGDVVFLSIVDGRVDSRRKIQLFLQKHPIQTPVVYDSAGVFIKKYDIGRNGYPLELRIGKDGIVKEAFTGFPTEGHSYIKHSSEFIDKLLN